MAGKKKPQAPRPLSDRQRRFVEAYLLDPNATAAATAAGYKEPNKQGPRLLVNVGVAAAISTAQAERSRRTQITADQVLREFALVAFCDLGEVMDFAGDTLALRPPSEIAESARRAIASIKVRRYTEGHGDDAREVEATEFKLHDKLSALEKIGKHLGMFKDSSQSTITVTSPVTFITVPVDATG